MYLHERENWTNFRWDNAKVSQLLESVSRGLGMLYGRLENFGFENQLKATAENLLSDIVGSSEIEGVKLNTDEVRSSIARKLGIKNLKNIIPSHYVDSVVSVMISAINDYNQKLTKQKLCAWQSAFFPRGMSEGHIVETGQYRSGEEYVVSGVMGREKIHYIAPSPDRVEAEMERFLNWFNGRHSTPLIISSAIAHLWFVTIHPFEDANGRISRILADMLLARADKSNLRFYNITSEINRDKNHYYDILERTERGDGDITEWLVWYLNTLQRSIDNANATISTTLNKGFFWMRFAQTPMTERQKNTLNIFLDGYEAKITSKNWASISKCSRDTANRDIADLVSKGVLLFDIPDAKRPSYSINYSGADDDISHKFRNIEIVQIGADSFITATLNGKKIRERILRLDSERIAKGEITAQQIAAKYMAYYVE